MDTRHLPASSSPRSWRTRCGCLECGSRMYPKGRRHRTTRSSLCARRLRPGLPSAPATWRGSGAQPLHACPRRFPASVSPSAQWEVPHLPHRYLAVSGFLWASVSQYSGRENHGCATSEPMAGLWSGLESPHLPHRQTRPFSCPGHCRAGDAGGTTQWKQDTERAITCGT